MSRTGNVPIKIKDIQLDIQDDHVKVSASKGTLTVPLTKYIKLIVKDDILIVERIDNTKKSKESHGLIRTLINNAIIGVTKGYSSNMELKGIGYRVQKKGSNLEFSLGYSHPIEFKLDKNISADVENTEKFTLTSIDKQLLGQVCAEIKRLRKKDSYKGKGIFFAGETIRKKAGKRVK